MTVRVWAGLRWGRDVPLEIVDVGAAADGARLEVPGPRYRPTRPALDPSAGPGGVAARVVRGDGEVLRFAVLVAEPGARAVVLILPEAPLALSPAGAGRLWVLGVEGLWLRDADGGVPAQVPRSGQALVAGAGGGVWLIDRGAAVHVALDGQASGPYDWPAGPRAAAWRGALCAIDATDDRLLMLEASGRRTGTPLPQMPEPLERLVAVDSGSVCTAAGTLLRRYGRDGTVRAERVQAAGLSASGRPFVSRRADATVELRVDAEPPRRLPVPPGVRAAEPFRAVALNNRRTLVYGWDHAAWYEGEQVQRELAVDDRVYRDELFPHMWSLGTQFPVGTPDGELVMSATGPPGPALIGVRLPPLRAAPDQYGAPGNFTRDGGASAT